jgi:hypothetical protein
LADAERMTTDPRPARANGTRLRAMASQVAFLRAAVQAPVWHLEVLRAAPRTNDQNTNPRLNSRLLTAGLEGSRFQVR